jgi:hypothetical protein
MLKGEGNNSVVYFIKMRHGSAQTAQYQNLVFASSRSSMEGTLPTVDAGMRGVYSIWYRYRSDRQIPMNIGSDR